MYLTYLFFSPSHHPFGNSILQQKSANNAKNCGADPDVDNSTPCADTDRLLCCTPAAGFTINTAGKSEASTCTPAGSVLNSDKASANTITGKTGDAVTVTCDAGYIANGATLTATCGMGGTFNTVVCTAGQASPCNVPNTHGPHVAKGTCPPAGGSLPSGDSCVVSCDAGYNSNSGSSTYVCSDGALTSATLICSPILNVNVCTAKANAAAWTALGCAVTTATATSVAGLGNAGPAAGYASCAITCPTNGAAFVVNAVANVPSPSGFDQSSNIMHDHVLPKQVHSRRTAAKKTCANAGTQGGAFNCTSHTNYINTAPAGITCAAQASGCTATECCTVVPKTCADTTGAQGGAFDCTSHANAIDAAPAGVTCAAQDSGCTATECCTVVPKTCADTTGAQGGAFDCTSHTNYINAAPAGVTCAADVIAVGDSIQQRGLAFGSSSHQCDGTGPGVGVIGTGIHCYSNINDGKYGNSFSWIPGGVGNGIAGVTFDKVMRISGFGISRDNGNPRKYSDRASGNILFEVYNGNPTQDQAILLGSPGWTNVGSTFAR